MVRRPAITRPAVLDLANPVEIAAVHIGSARPHLAADLSAPLLDMLEGTPPASIAGFLQPFGSGDTRPHLEMLEPHQPGRIPVVFIHGLASDEGTWFDMLNELRAWPEFHRRFEPWVFYYPTGAAFLQSSGMLRRQLAAAVRRAIPRASDPAMRKLVLVGHSMGGLQAKLQVVDSGNELWEAIACVPFDQIRLRPELRRRVAPAYFFEPQPFVRRIVCIATPHEGSLLASLGVGRLASLTVRSPPRRRLSTTRRCGPIPMPSCRTTSADAHDVDLLRARSGMLQAIERLRPPCWVTVHSIVGDGHSSLTGGRDDCVVPVEQAHTEGATSEIFVPATHTKVHHHPQDDRRGAADPHAAPRGNHALTPAGDPPGEARGHREPVAGSGTAANGEPVRPLPGWLTAAMYGPHRTGPSRGSSPHRGCPPRRRR